MVTKPNARDINEGPPPIDESWWSAILAEEEPALRESAGGLGSPAAKKSPRQLAVNWGKARKTYDLDEAVNLLVVGYNRGGLLVEGVELQGFVPISHLVDLSEDSAEEDRDRLLSRYVNTSLRLKVIECDPARGRVVFSERAALSEPGKRTALLTTLRPGDQVCGIVTNITDFGVFVDLGGLEGLIHVSELSWGRVHHPEELVRVGQLLDVYVIQVDRDRLRVALSLKRLSPNPWETAEARYQPGQTFEAIITSILPFGAFARLEEGLDGLIHVSEMSSLGDSIKPETFLSEGQHVQVKVIHVDASRQRLGLSLVQ
jgi:small subunit ribosomal protein S1